MAVTISNIDECPGCGAEKAILKEVYGVPVCEKCAPKCFSEKIRKQIKQKYDFLSEKKRREIWNKRVELVKNGVKCYKNKNFSESLRNYREYLALLEMHHRVPAGGLTPKLFSKKHEAGDILLLSGIFWDMVKIYDKIPGKLPEMQSFLNKYVEFSIGRPHVVLASETLRKYIGSNEIKNKAPIESAYKVISNSMSKCFIATAVFGPDTNEITVLRDFRDKILNQTFYGKIIIQIYYKISPPIAVYLTHKPFYSKIFKFLLTRFVKIIRLSNNRSDS